MTSWWTCFARIPRGIWSIAILGMAILVIQACTDEVPAGEPEQAALDGGAAPPPGVEACVSWVEDASRVLRRAELGARPGLAVAVTAVADARAVLRDLAA